MVDAILRNKKIKPIIKYDEKTGKPYVKIIERTSNKELSVAEITLCGQDILHYHRDHHEVYCCLEGRGYLYIEGEGLLHFVPGNGEIRPTVEFIEAGKLHAAVPEYPREELVFLCFSVPGYSENDFLPNPAGREWWDWDKKSPLGGLL